MDLEADTETSDATGPQLLVTPKLDEWVDETRDLLDRAFDGDFSGEDWAHALGGWHALVLEHNRVVAHGAVVARTLWVGAEAHQVGYVEAVATEPHRQRCGHGTTVMSALNQVIGSRFDFGALSTSSHEFYERLGWVRWTGPTFVIENGSWVRTPDEDAGIMVLRSPNVHLNRTAPLGCEPRSGDDW